MKYQWLSPYCLAMPGVTEEYKPEWDAVRYMIGTKMFAMAGSNKQKEPILTIKLEPAFIQLVKSQYPQIAPGYYMNKDHWCSVPRTGDVPDELVKQMLDQGYQLVFGSFSKKAREAILSSVSTSLPGQRPSPEPQDGSAF